MNENIYNTLIQNKLQNKKLPSIFYYIIYTILCYFITLKIYENFITENDVYMICFVHYLLSFKYLIFSIWIYTPNNLNIGISIGYLPNLVKMFLLIFDFIEMFAKYAFYVEKFNLRFDIGLILYNKIYFIS